jgi:hypothetical protein
MSDLPNDAVALGELGYNLMLYYSELEDSFYFKPLGYRPADFSMTRDEILRLVEIADAWDEDLRLKYIEHLKNSDNPICQMEAVLAEKRDRDYFKDAKITVINPKKDN